ncbi:MAG: hypothetical protein EZS28_023896 [Streblomastix strix]|uniref:Integrase catalytic domain-containing protein n=1 Tax=Streblomastix strix TaxID=222440 RepID=A0A5J4VDF7_9EUKA|nr:MAG: hypothetical protein EZS28_023896 [Streblomastix strix]
MNICVPRLRNKPRTQAQNQIQPDHGPILEYPFKSKIQHFKKLHGKSPDKIQDIPPDYQIKPLSKLNRPYFSPKLGTWEIDLVFSMNERIIRANQIYLFCININTKYLVVFPLRDKSAGQIKNALQILVKNYHVTNIRGDGEKGFNGSILKSFCQEHKITSFFTDSKFTNHNRVVDSVIRTIRNAFGDDSQKFADNDLMQHMVKIIVIPNRDELASIHKIIDQYDEKVIKIQEQLSITDKDQVVFNELGYIQENPNNSSEDGNEHEQDHDDNE